MLLTSLYLPWRTISCGSGCIPGLKSLGVNNGWSSGVGDSAALFGLLLAAVAAAALIRPNLERRLPSGLCALLMGYFGLAVAAQMRSTPRAVIGFHYAYGAYLGIAAAVIALIAGVAILRDDLRRARAPAQLATIVLGIALLVSFLLPWFHYAAAGSLLGIAEPAAVVAAAAVVCLLEVSGAARFVVGLAVGLFAVGAFGSAGFPASHAYGAWIGFCAGIAIAALAVPSRVALPSLRVAGRLAFATGAAAALFVAALFLPWQKACYARSTDFGPYAGRCVSTNGWANLLGAAAALLAIGLVLAAFGRRRSVSAATPAVGLGILVATMGFQLESRTEAGLQLGFGYGSIIGFVAAGALLALGLVGVRPPKLDIRLAPVAACAAYLAVVVLPWWLVLPSGAQSALRFAPPSWLTVTGVLLAVWLVQLWLDRGALRAESLVIVPLGMLALASLDLIRTRSSGLGWGGAAIVILCLLLAGFGRLEQQAVLGKARVPKSLRLDRL